VALLGLLTLVVGVGGACSAVGGDSAPTSTTTTTSTTGRDTTTEATPAPAGDEPGAPRGAAAPGATFSDVPYCVTDGAELDLDFFHATSAEVTPLIVFAHGGGYRRGDKNQAERLPEFDDLIDAGYSIASIDYRLSPEHPFPAPIEDLKCAVRHLRANAAGYGIDPDRIGLMGFSSGAHLAMLAAVADEAAGFDVGQYAGVSSAVKAVVAADGPTDIAELRSSQPDVASDTFLDSLDLMHQASPTTYADPGDPPMLIFHGELDRTVPVVHAKDMDEALTDAGVEHEVVIVPGGAHKWPSSQGMAGSAEYSQKIESFLAEHLR
jgi:acetyl esterase/lipase